MTLAFSLQTIFEIFLVVAVFWGIFNEGKLIAFEKQLVSAIRRRRLKVINNNSRCRVVNGR